MARNLHEVDKGTDVAGPAGTGAQPDEEEDGAEWETWDPRRSLFDNHLSETLEANLEYMWRSFHFTVPDSEFLQDAPGLLTYLVSHHRFEPESSDLHLPQSMRPDIVLGCRRIVCRHHSVPQNS